MIEPSTNAARSALLERIQQLESELNYERSRANHLEEQISWLNTSRQRLEERLQERQRFDAWRRAVLARPTKELSPAEKLVATSLYATFRGRERHGKPLLARAWVGIKAKGVGVSAETYGRTLRSLAESGVIERREETDRTSGYKSVLVGPTPTFWNPDQVRRPEPRHYGRSCPDHPAAGVREIRETVTFVQTVRRITRTFVCAAGACGRVVDTEIDEQTLGERRIFERIDRLECRDTPQLENFELGGPTDDLSETIDKPLLTLCETHGAGDAA